MIPIKSPNQVNRIINSFIKVFKTNDIEHLSKQAYDFIYLASGFIAHYNIGGFKDNYKNVNLFRYELNVNQPHNQWMNFSPNDEDYLYYMQKRKIYNEICKCARKF